MTEESTEDTVTVTVNTANEYNVRSGMNMANHSTSRRGRAKFVRQMNPTVPTFRTKQEAYRYAAWIVAMAEHVALPDEDDQEGVEFDQVLVAVEDAMPS